MQDPLENELERKIYEWLTTQLAPIESRLDVYGATELDGILWQMAKDLRSKYINAIHETLSEPIPNESLLRSIETHERN